MPTLQSLPAPGRGLVLGACVALLAVAGCGDIATDVGLRPSTPPTVAPDVQRVEPVTQSGRPAAVLSVHMRKAYQDACKFGLTMTNNLPFKITALTYRITAIVNGDVPYDTQNKSFNEVRPGERQYRELTFQRVRCDEIDRLELTDPGRCNLSDLNRFNAGPGDCAKFSDVPRSPVVTVVWKQK